MKKTVSLILALILTCTTLFSLASCGILQRSQCNCDCVKYEGSEGLDFYPLPNGTYGVKVGNAIYLEKIIIPDEYNGKPVTQILSDGFESIENLKEITIPASVNIISEDAFSRCASLTSITYKGTVEEWNSISFGTGWNNQVPATKIVCSNGEFIISAIIYTLSDDGTYYIVSTINNSVKGNVSIESEINGIPVKEIKYSAFSDCFLLESIEIPSSVEIIQSGAFKNCTALTSVVIPASVTFIGQFVFSGCDSLNSVTFLSPDDWYGSQYADLFDARELTLTDPFANATAITRKGLVMWFKKGFKF